MRYGRVAWILLGGVALAIGWRVVVQSVMAEEKVTDAQISERFGRTHQVMKDQQQRLSALLNAFLMGDTEAIQRYTEQIGQDMARVSQTFPPEPGKEVQQWRAMAEIMERTRALKDSAAAGQYDKAYVHFVGLTKHCMICHQVRREAGKFPQLDVEPAQPTAPSVGRPSK